MKPKPETVAYIGLRVEYPTDQGDATLPEAVLDYHRQIEEWIDTLEDLEHVDHIGSSASSYEDSGREWWHEDYTIALLDSQVVGQIAERIVRFVRRLGIRNEHNFSLRKQIVLKNGEREICSRRIYPSRDTKWMHDHVKTSLKSRPNSSTEFPRHLGYLSEMAMRCDGIGGNDVYQLFEKKTDLEKFINSLSSKNRAKLVEIYLKIVRCKHNEWFLSWLRSYENESGESPKWTEKLHRFLCVMDRLREGGLLNKTQGKAKQTVLVYWDDYLGGEPYTEKTE